MVLHNFCGLKMSIMRQRQSMKYNRFRHVPFGIVCSPFLLSGTAKFNLKQLGTPVSKAIGEIIAIF